MGARGVAATQRNNEPVWRAPRVTLAELAAGKAKGRTDSDQITYSERGNLQGVRFFAIAAKIYEAARRAGIGREIPTERFLQDIRD